MYGLAGLFVPASLSIALTIAEGGFVSIIDGKPVLDYGALFMSPLTWSIVVLSIVAVLYISSVFYWYANKAGDTNATSLLRKYALISAIPLIIAAVGIIVELSSHNPAHFEKNHRTLVDVWFIVSIMVGDFLAHLEAKKLWTCSWIISWTICPCFLWLWNFFYPYLLYPHLTVQDGFTNEAMAISLVVVFILGLILLIPSIYLLMKLFLFDKDYVKGNSNKKIVNAEKEVR